MFPRSLTGDNCEDLKIFEAFYSRCHYFSKGLRPSSGDKSPIYQKCRPDNLLGGSNLAVPPGEKRCSHIVYYTSNVFLDILNTPSYIAVPAEHIALKYQKRCKILKRSKYFLSFFLLMVSN